jgi:hypothetical protein
MPPHTTENSCLARENPRNLPNLPAEHSGGGFADSPDVPASALGPWIVYSLHAGCRVERETSGLDPVDSANPSRRFDGFDKLPFDRLRVFDTAGRLKAPSPSTPLGTLSLSNGRVEGLTLAATRSRRRPQRASIDHRLQLTCRPALPGAGRRT